MILVAWLFNVIAHLRNCSSLILLELVPSPHVKSRVFRPKQTTAAVYVVMIGAAVISFDVAVPAWCADLPVSVLTKPRKTVAAGFGFQDAETSSITVKTYDADSGEVLSTETYELDVKDDGAPASQPRVRVFAGGVGVGADDLSEFTLRVYDASNGRFLWEGRLNIGVKNDPDVAAYPVIAQVQPRAAVTMVSGQTKTFGQPYFVLRAMNPETGQLIWADEFSADAAIAQAERISRSIIGMTGAAPRDIDFRIRMMDESGRQLVWEDKVVPAADDEAAPEERSDETASMLPVWPSGRGKSAHQTEI